jgi:hypothetical protein
LDITKGSSAMSLGLIDLRCASRCLRHDRQEIVLGDGHGVVILGQFGGQADIDGPAHDPVAHLGVGTLDQHDFDAGIARGEILDDGRQQPGRRRGDRAHAHAARLQPDQHLGAVAHPFDGFERLARVGLDRRARGRRRHAAAIAQQQHDAERFLQRGHGLAHARLGQAQLVRGGGEAPLLQNREEGFELADIDAR